MTTFLQLVIIALLCAVLFYRHRPRPHLPFFQRIANMRADLQALSDELDQIATAGAAAVQKAKDDAEAEVGPDIATVKAKADTVLASFDPAGISIAPPAA